MKTYLLLILNTFFFFNYSFSQAPAIEWQNTIGGINYDALYSLQQTTDGGYILGGESGSGFSGDKTEAFLGGIYDFWVVKLDGVGAIEWQNTIGGSNEDRLRSLQQTTDGGYILGGKSSSGISGDKTEASLGGYDYWVVKLDSSGLIEWQNTIGGIGSEELYSIKQTIDGGYILGGKSNSGISGDKTETSFGGYDYWVLKLNSSGAIEWQNAIGGSSDDGLTSLQQTTDGGYVLEGYSNSGISGDKSEASLGGYDYWVVKLNSSGTIEWQNAIGGSTDDVLQSIQQTTDGGYILGGYSNSGISGDKTEAKLGWYDYWVVKLNSSGTIEWQNTIGGSGDDLLYSLQQTTDGGYILGGPSWSGISGDKTEANLGAGITYDYWVVKLNSGGAIEWQNNIGGSSLDYLQSLQQTTDGGYILGGYSLSGIFGDKTEAQIGSYDYWIVKLEGPACAPFPEICNSIDDNCNGLIDDGVLETISITAGGPITFCQGSSVSLTATYSGATVQWKKNGTNIPGATVSNYNVTTKGNYSCVTASACGTVESTPIFVNVYKNPNASISAGGATTFCAGGSVVLTEVAVAGCTYQWYKGASPIAGATSLNYTATTSGNYKCRVTKTATGCFKNSNTIAVSVPCREGLPDGEAGEMLENEIIVYPNPATTSITISTNNISTKTILITDALGQILHNSKSEENIININIENLAAGMYFVKIEEGHTIYTGNFVKH